MINRRTGGLLISAAAAAMFAAPVAAYAQQASRSYNVPAQGLDSALKAIAAVSGEQIIYGPASVQGKRSTAIVGNYSTDAAVAAALRGTGLSVSRSPRGVLVVTTAASRPEQVRGENEAGSAAAQIGDAVPDDPLAQEIVVTGSHIRGAAPAGANLIVSSREDLARTSRGSLADALQTLPQVHGGGANPGTLVTGKGGAPNNFGNAGSNRGASSLNLRGIGVEETLVLLNGRRIPSAGRDGAFADISVLPLAAVSRVEILADGASATYGADAMAGVVNIIMDRKFNGSETRIRIGAETRSGQGELQASQTLGRVFGNAHFLLSGEYSRQEGITARNRSFAASADLRARGGGDHRSSQCSPGTILSPGELLGGIPPGQDGSSLTPDQILIGQWNRCENYEGRHLIPETERGSVYLSGGLQLGGRLQLSADLLASKRTTTLIGSFPVGAFTVPVSNAFRQMNGLHGDSAPLNQPIFIVNRFEEAGPDRAYTTSWALLGSAGLDYDLGGSWNINLYGSYGRYHSKGEGLTLDIRPASEGGAFELALSSPDASSAYNPFGGPGANSEELVESFFYPFINGQKSRYNSASFIVSGPLFDLPGGALKLAFGGDYRKEAFDRSIHEHFRGTKPEIRESGAFSGERNVKAAFAELFLPIFSDLNATAGANSLSISVSGRYDRYSDFGSTFNPKIGATWGPVRGLVLKGSYGTSFKAPLISSLYDESTVQYRSQRVASGGPDPNGDGLTNILFVSGGNRELDAERGKSWTAGFEVEPPSIEGLRVHATYFNLKFRGRFSSELLENLVFADPDAYRNIAYFPEPSELQVESVIASVDRIIGGLPPAGDVEAIIDRRTLNFASQIIDGIDAGFRYRWDGLGGTFALNGSAAYLSRYKSRLGQSVNRTNYLNNVGLPVRSKGRGGIAWNSDSFAINGAVNYVGTYKNRMVTPRESIDDYMTFDLSLEVKLGRAKSLSFHVLNLADARPPFVNNSAGVAYDGANADPIGRRVALQFIANW